MAIDSLSTTSRCCDEFEESRRRQSWLYGSRRDFLKTTLGAIALGGVAPQMMLEPAFARHVKSGQATTGPILVVIQLAGGNDGLNTIVPYASDQYYRDRPTISVPAASVLHIDSAVGFNPNLAALKPLYDAGKVAVIQDVGYPNPDRSHFRSTQIWESGDPVGSTTTGWLGRYLDTSLSDDNNPMKALALGPLVPLTLLAQRTPVPSIESINTFRFLLSRNDARPILDAFRTMYADTAETLPPYIGLVKRTQANADSGVKELHGITSSYKSTVQYPQSPLARDLQLVSQIIATGIGTRIFHVTLGGFDDHIAEVYTHAALMKQLSEAMAAFQGDLQSQGKADEVVTMTFSEFGRRVKENSGRGTDHGTAAPMFVIGNKVKGGIYGNDVSLTNLDGNGDLTYQTDFRSVYATIVDGWLAGDSRQVLNGSFDRLPFL